MSMIMSLFMSSHVNITLRLVSDIINYSCEKKRKKEIGTNILQTGILRDEKTIRFEHMEMQTYTATKPIP